MIDVVFAAADRLAQRASNSFAFVGTLADLAALDDVPRQLPAAYIVPEQETASPGEVVGASIQQHELTFSAVILVRHAGDAGGGRAALALQPLRDAVQAAFVGWTPAGCHAPVTFAGGSLNDLMAGGTVAWQDTFTALRRVQRTLQQT